MANIIPADDKPDQPAILLIKIAKKAAQLARKLDKLEEEYTRIADDLQLLVEILCKEGSQIKLKQLTGVIEVIPENIENVLRDIAYRGVKKVVIDRKIDGSAPVVIDESPTFYLAPMLADLLEILCLDHGNSNDDLVEYK